MEDGSQTMFQAGEGDYTAPECESLAEGFEPGKIGRASDIWSFGCVLAEILAYLSVEPVHGPTAVAEFDQDRKRKVGKYITSVFFGDNEVNPAVQRLLKDCRATLHSRLGPMADVVDTILRFEPSQRSSALNITRSLFHLTQQSRVHAIIAILTQNFEPMELELEIETERFRVWSQAVAVGASMSDLSEPKKFQQSYTVEEFDNLQRLLVRIQTEASMIATELKTSSGRPAFRLYHRLQKLHDQLWDSQPLAVRRHMSDRLEENMLNEECLVQPQETLESISSNVKGGHSSLSEWLCRRLTYLAMMRNIASSLVRQDRQTQDNYLDRARIKGPFSDLGPHTVGTIEPEGNRILVEFLNYGKTWNDRESELLERVNAVTCLRSKGVLESFSYSAMPRLLPRAFTKPFWRRVPDTS